MIAAQIVAADISRGASFSGFPLNSKHKGESTVSRWDELEMETKILDILDVWSHAPEHHFGRPFLTPYQIAIMFREKYPEDFAFIGLPVGGKEIGQRNSLAQYIAAELSRCIIAESITSIEGCFLHRANLHALQYEMDGVTITSSTEQVCDLSMYRIKG